jgi:hypothetical protein
VACGISPIYDPLDEAIDGVRNAFSEHTTAVF